MAKSDKAAKKAKKAMASAKDTAEHSAKAASRTASEVGSKVAAKAGGSDRDAGAGSSSGGGGGSKIWSVMSLVSALGAASIAKKGVNASWKAATGKNPPANPADPDVRLAEAVMWAAVSGTLVQIARMLATRKAATYFQKSTGHLPPGLEKDDQDPSKPTPRS